MTNYFDHIPNTLDALDETLQAPATAPVTPANGYQSPTHIEPCKKCRGTGRFRSLGPCFACKGAGKLTFKSTPEARAKAKVQRAARAARSAAEETARGVENVEAFKIAQPEIFAWIQSSPDFPFAVAMLAAVGKYGSLTVNQLAACQRCVDGRKRAQEARAAATASAPTVDISKLELALTTAAGNGLKNPKLRVAEFKFSRAAATSKNPGAVYVKEGSEYLGKIVGGKFLCVHTCDAEREAKILEACVDPQAAAIAYGRLTGSCSCCGRELTDPVSIERGIGPICESKYGW